MANYSMGLMSIDGIISNLKTSEIISKLMEIERKPIKILQQKQAGYEKKITAWQEGNAKLLALKASISPLRYKSAFEAKKATSSNENILTASAGTSAIPGVYSVKVKQLAKKHIISSDAQNISDASIPLLTKFGISGDQIFTINVGNTSVQVTIDSDDTLSDMRDKINASGAGVSATIVNDTSSTQRLIITSKNAGTSNTINLIDSPGGLLDALALPVYSFYDDFNYPNGPAPGWTPIDSSVSTWVVQDKKYLGIGLGAGNNDRKASLFDNTDTNYEYSLRFEIQGGSGANYPYIGAYLRYDDENNWIRVELQNNGTNYVMRAISYENGEVSSEVTVAIPNYSSGEHILKIRDFGSQLDVYLNNTKFIENFVYNPGNITATRKGILVNQATSAKFDDIRVGKNIRNTLQNAQDAILEVNGIEIIRSSNTITDAIQGTTLNLVKENPVETVSVSITPNIDAIKTSISNFITQYNNVISFFKDQFYYDPESKKAGILFGDPTLISIQKSLQDIVFSQVDPRFISEVVGMGDGVKGNNWGDFRLGNEITSISDIRNITIGTTSIPFGGEGAIFSSGWYAEVRLNGELRFFKDGVPTPVENAKSIRVTYAPAEKVNIQGTRYNLSKTINSLNNITRIIAVYGGNTTDFVIRQQNGRTGSGYEVEVNIDDTSPLNGELRFYDNGVLIDENALSNVKASYVSKDALYSLTQLGFSTYAVSDTSIKVDESILYSQLQNNLDNVKDLFNRSYLSIAYKIDDYLNDVTKRITGIIDLSIAGIRDQIKLTRERISKLEETMVTREARYRKMFYEMEKALGLMQSQSTWLSQQINRLPSSWLLQPRSTTM